MSSDSNRLLTIQENQAAAERSAKLDQFNRESERQYVALVYTDLTSGSATRQRAALSLFEILQPETSLKLLAWALTTFDKDDETGAREAAKILDELLPNNSASMRARRQSAASRPGTLGIWF